METLEIVVYIIVAVAVGGLIVFFLNRADIIGISDEVGDRVLNERKFEFKTVDWDGFYQEVFAFWKKHQFSEGKAEMILFLNEQGRLDKLHFFDTVRKGNLCRTLQSRSFDCGTREDVSLSTVELPQVIRVQYENETLIINEADPSAGDNVTLRLLLLDFGGFEGNGDMIRNIGSLPSDARVVTVRLTLIAGTDFTLSFNNQQCGDVFMASPGETTWDLTNCSWLLKLQADNSMSLRFLTSDLWRKYLAGGYLAIVYDSEQERIPQQRIYLPEVDGSVNYFGGVTFADAPQGLDICLHYRVGDLQGKDFYATVGNQIVYQDITPNHEKPLGCTHVGADKLRQGINPIRIGVDSDVETTKEVSVPQPVDSVLITDQSGSMACDLDEIEPQSCLSRGDLGDVRNKDCNHPDLLSDQTQKLILAQCFGREFSRIILDTYSKNRIGLVSFHQRVEEAVVRNLTSDYQKLEDTLMRYEPSGRTCVSCAIEKAREILASTPKKKAMVIMTDGVANNCIPGVACGEEMAAAEALEQAAEAANEDISLFTIAFGLNDPQGVELLQEIACLDNCSNFGYGNTPEEIQNIYRKFAEAIANKLAVMTRRVQGSPQEVFAPSKLYGDSYIQVSPAPAAATGVRLRVSKRLDCEDSFDIPSNLAVSDCQLSSVAGKYWTDQIELNGQIIYDLQQYGGASYYLIGDPATFGLQLAMLQPRNTLKTMMGDVGEPHTEGLINNTVQYTVTAGLPAQGFRTSEGCHWTVGFPEEERKLTIPPSYVGDHECAYTQERIDYTATDVYQSAAAQLFIGLDADSNGIVDDAVDEVQVLGGLT
jgi:hypothetical protein